jgi:glycyl-tRNA synthetase beta chain
LADAKFFWDQDRSRTLASRAPELADITYHARLGSLDAKMDRVQALAVEIAGMLPKTKGLTDKVRSAARLAKADLTTGMVGEFPELQGVMGRYYAQHDGEDQDVADAIAEHYAPVGPSDQSPKAPVSIALALADKIDTLVGFFTIGEKPTGSRDPYALRRAVLGVIRIVLENNLRLKLGELFRSAAALLKKHIKQIDGDEIANELLAFAGDRLKVHLREQGVRHDHISAIFEQGAFEDDLVRLMARVEALRAFLDSEDGANLLIAYRRAANIVRIEEKKDGASYDKAPSEAALEADEEKRLFETLGDAADYSAKAARKEDFQAAMGALADLRGPVDDFFEHVTVNVDKKRLRDNRLRLLSAIRDTMDRLADFSKIEG